MLIISRYCLLTVISVTYVCANHVVITKNLTIGGVTSVDNNNDDGGQLGGLDDEDDEETSSIENSNNNTARTISDSDSASNLSISLKFPTPCETPNLEPAVCIQLKECPVLLQQLNNTKSWDFLRASRCGPDNEDRSDPKICCGKRGNYRNSSSNHHNSNSNSNGNKDIDVSLIDDDKVFPKVCGSQRILIRGRIMGGSQASLGEFPWMARLLHRNEQGYKSFGCSGFLIHSKYVLTAGHCVVNKILDIRGPLFSVVLGEHNTETKIDCSPMGTFCADPVQISRVAKVIVHPEYDPKSKGHFNDIALLHLNKGARITEFVKPICLLFHTIERVQKYTISGWGKTETDDFSKIKMKVDLRPFDRNECVSKYSLLNIDLRNTQMCVGGEKGKDSCSGDSGGPLMMTNGSHWFAAGIVSYGLSCGYEGWPGVYTNIPYYMTWIKKQIVANSMVNGKNNKVRRHHKKKNMTTMPKSSSSTAINPGNIRR